MLEARLVLIIRKNAAAVGWGEGEGARSQRTGFVISIRNLSRSVMTRELANNQTDGVYTMDEKRLNGNCYVFIARAYERETKRSERSKNVIDSAPTL